MLHLMYVMKNMPIKKSNSTSLFDSFSGKPSVIFDAFTGAKSPSKSGLNFFLSIRHNQIEMGKEISMSCEILEMSFLCVYHLLQVITVSEEMTPDFSEFRHKQVKIDFLQYWLKIDFLQ